MDNISEVTLTKTIHEEHGHKDAEGAKLGMWLFLLTELLLFGGLFVIYGTYRYLNPEAFHIASLELNISVGTLNTFILLTSSLTVAMSITALQKGQKVLSLILIGSTILFALAFLVNKYFEWSAKFQHGIFPGSPELANKPAGEVLYFGLYYTMTGLHGVHVFVGIVILSFIFVFVARDKITPNDFAKLENSALYWHLVDIIWIFLFPLFYLIK
ncbi:MAG: cytochrome c oxidase subunit 3 [Ignavibacteriales bacterium]|nr:cytochrome c oxidase subunit 3 [Ignavibacteriales bacterium]